MSNYITAKEAAILLNLTDRTIRRRLEKLDEKDKKKYVQMSKNKILIDKDFVLARFKDMPKKELKKDVPKKEDSKYIESLKLRLEDQKRTIDRLEKTNDNLLNDLRRKDDHLLNIEDKLFNLVDDFKILTSKVLALEEKNSNIKDEHHQQLKELQEAKVQQKEKQPGDTKLFIIVIFVFMSAILGAVLLFQMM